MFVSKRVSAVCVNSCVFEGLGGTHCCDKKKGVVKARPLDKRYSQKYADQTGDDHKGEAQGNSNDYPRAVISVGDDGVRRIISIGDMQLGTLRHFSQPLDRALGRESRVRGRIKQLLCEVKEVQM
jgi:hypothetical protein